MARASQKTSYQDKKTDKTNQDHMYAHNKDTIIDLDTNSVLVVTLKLNCSYFLSTYIFEKITRVNNSEALKWTIILL